MNNIVKKCKCGCNEYVLSKKEYIQEHDTWLKTEKEPYKGKRQKRKGHVLKCANDNCSNMIYIKKCFYDVSDYKLFCCSKNCKNTDNVIKRRLKKFEEIHGYVNVYQREDVKEKIKETNLDRYNAENPFGSEEIKERIKETNLKRYNVENPQQNKEIKDKTIETLIRNHPNDIQGCVVKSSYEKTCLNRYGAKQFFASEFGKLNKENLVKYYNYTDEEVEDLCKSKAITIDNMINKYGKKEGLKRYLKWYDSIKNTKENFIKRHGIIEGTKRYENSLINKINNWKMSNRYSKISIECFDAMIEHLPKDSSIFYNNNEWFLFNIFESSKKIFFYDFRYRYKIIEFNGDFWHANPNFYKSDYIFKFADKIITSKEIWDIDRMKIANAELSGFETFIIWESDYKNNKEYVINKAIKFLFS